MTFWAITLGFQCRLVKTTTQAMRVPQYTSLKCGGIYLLYPFKFGLFMWQNLVLGGRTNLPTHIYILKNGDSSAGRVLGMQLSRMKHVKLECRRPILNNAACILQKRNCMLLAKAWLWHLKRQQRRTRR